MTPLTLVARRAQPFACLAMIAVMAGCQEALVRPLATPPSAALARVTITDTLPEDQRPISEILQVLADPHGSDGSLIVGLKEPGARRGVSLLGVQLPVAARLAAEKALRADFPRESFESGVTRLTPYHDQFGVRIDTLIRPYVVLKGPFNQQRLAALLASPLVSYI